MTTLAGDKDMIITDGENVYPAEVERALADLPGVVDFTVVGTPDERWGEAVLAVLSVADGATVTIEDVREHAGRTLARYKLASRLRLPSRYRASPPASSRSPSSARC